MSPNQMFSTALAALCILAAPVLGESTDADAGAADAESLSLIHISEPTRH